MESTPSRPRPTQPTIEIEKLKAAAMAQAISQSLGSFKLNEKDSQYGNFLIPIPPPL